MTTTLTCPHCGGELRNLVANQGTVREPLMKLAEVEKILGISRHTLKKHIYCGRLRATRVPGPTTPWMVSESALADFRQRHSL